MKIIRNILIIFFYLTAIPFWRRVFLKKPLLRVWCLHEVKNNQIGQFEKKIKYLKVKYNVITPEQFLNQNLSSDKVNILITFDDGFTNWLNNVLPVLNKYNLKAVFFLEKNNEHLSGKLMEEGHSVGGHSVTHPYLTQLNQSDLKNEIQLSIKSKFFAYPFGDKKSFNQNVIEEIKHAGYQYAFTILPGFNNKKINSYLLHRDSLDTNVSDFIFQLWLKGCYDFKR